MQVDIKDAAPDTFAQALSHLRDVGASAVSIFADRRQTEGPWLVAFVVVDGRRHVRWTGEAWEGRTLEQQATDLAAQLEALQLLEPVDHGV